MSVTAQITKGVFLGDDANTNFPFTFDVKAASEIEVTIKDAATPPNFTVITTNFTVDLGLKTVTFPNSGSPLPTGQKLILRRITPKTQGLDLKNQGNYSGEDQEDAYDKLTRIMQDMQEEVSRAAKFPLDEFPDPSDSDTFITRAEAAATASETAQSAAETAQTAAEAAQAAAEAAQVAAEAAQVRLSLIGTFDEINEIAKLNPTLIHKGFATDLIAHAVYSGNPLIGNQGWFFGAS